MDDAAAAQRSWDELIAREHEAYERILSTPANPNLLHEWWQALEHLLVEYRRRLNAHAHVDKYGQREWPAPPLLTVDVIHRLTDLVGSLATGKIPDLIRYVAHRGNPKHSPGERDTIRFAVAYLRACTPQGLVHLDYTIKIDDLSSTRTICEWFGVKARTVQEWTSKFEPADLGPRKLGYSGGFKRGRPHFDASRESSDDPKLTSEARALVWLVRYRGELYKAMSHRSAASIATAARKRSDKPRRRKVRVGAAK